ncbi:MAG: hypothetical protein QNJ90_10710 [Planctomycetota bacterium]|nr:hypothetical protein [Planctomycetota bacterium]
MTHNHRTRASLRAGAICAVAVLASAVWSSPAAAGDLPPPQVRHGSTPRVSVRQPVRTAPRRQVANVPTAPTPRPAFLTGKPSEPVASRGGKTHSTYVPPLGAPKAPRARPEPVPVRARPAPVKAIPVPVRVAARPRGRVPVTTFRVAPAPTPRRTARLAPISAPKPRRTTWSPRPSAVPSTGPLPAPAVAKVSPSYAELDRTRAQTVTSRSRPVSATPRRRTLQRRGETSTLKRRAVRSRDLSVPMAPGQSAPRAPIRRTLPLSPPPGCDGGG